MYEYVTKAQAAPYKDCCQKILKGLLKKLKEEHAISAFILLTGSGANELITRNGDGVYDLDYNLLLTSMPDAYEHTPGKLKDLVRKILDSLAGPRFSHGQDSTSSITYLAHSADGKKVAFSFDLALLWKKKGAKSKYKLVHDKRSETFIWNQIPGSKRLDAKAAAIKRAGRWNELRKTYLERKNKYLKNREEQQHPSFVIYTEVINEIYHSIKQK